MCVQYLHEYNKIFSPFHRFQNAYHIIFEAKVQIKCVFLTVAQAHNSELCHQTPKQPEASFARALGPCSVVR